MIPAFFGLAGPKLTAAERALFAAAQPAGYILFRRNCVSAAGIRALTDELRGISGRDDLAILIDQEGGRVARLVPPEFATDPPAADYGALYARNPEAGLRAARLGSQAIAVDLQRLGINVDCLPVLDLGLPGADPVIGDRAYGADPATVAALGRSALDGLSAGGVVGVVKHIPGHGRALVDSHHGLPVVDTPRALLSAQDFQPFRALADAPIAMTAHIVYAAIDADHCATLSKKLIDEVIRGEIGFSGLLISDDLSMRALSGSLAERARAALAAGCDIVLHCNGDYDEMAAIADAVAAIAPVSQARLDRAMAGAHTPVDGDAAALRAERDACLRG